MHGQSIHPSAVVCLIVLQSNVERSDDKYSPRVPLQLHFPLKSRRSSVSSCWLACCDRFRFIYALSILSSSINDRWLKVVVLQSLSRAESSHSKDSQNQSTFIAYLLLVWLLLEHFYSVYRVNRSDGDRLVIKVSSVQEPMYRWILALSE